MKYTDTYLLSPLQASLSAVMVAFAFLAFAMPQSAMGQATCYAVESGSWKGETRDDGSGNLVNNWADSPGGDPGTCNGSGTDDAFGQTVNYPASGDEAVIETDVRIELNVDLTSAGEGPLSSLTLEAGDINDAQGTVLTFANEDLEVTGPMNVQARGGDNGLQMASTDGQGNVTVGGQVINMSGRIDIGR